MKTKNYRYFVGDFETTVYDGQEDTQVWASAIVELYTEDVNIFNSIDDTFDYLVSLNENIIVYYHNLKFDGTFWLSYLIDVLHFKQAIKITGNGVYDKEFLLDKEMENKSFKYMISAMGDWYSIVIKVRSHFIEFRDSLKLLPFTVRRIGEGFKTKHQKLDMEYKGFRYAGCIITDEEKNYIANDVFVVKEALEIMFEEGHKKLTIGSCCLNEYKSEFFAKTYQETFPDLTEIKIPFEIYGSENADEYIRRSYKGGWCYLVKGKEGCIFHNGTTADVNSLYPSVMSSDSGSIYPYGEPTFWVGDIPKRVLDCPSYKYYFVRIKTRFKIKKGKLPCIQIKSTFRYRSNEWLETSDMYDTKTGKYYSSFVDEKGEKKETFVVLTLTMTDYKLIQEHYDLIDCQVLDGCWFFAKTGLFDDYIDKYRTIKMTSKGAKRELAKLFLNNLYGKMASSTDSSFKIAFQKEDGSIGYEICKANNKKAGFIAVGSAITSYARNFTIRAAQANYHGVNNRGFIYADTDSIHCDLLPDEIKDIKADETKFCCWKLESCWDIAYYVRQKTYMEHIIKENLKECEPHYELKCAGMPDNCKKLFIHSLNQDITKEEYDKLKESEKIFVDTKREIEDFNIGLIVPGKLMPKRIRGGTLLVETTFEMR